MNYAKSYIDNFRRYAAVMDGKVMLTDTIEE